MSVESEFRSAAQEIVAVFTTGTHILRRPNGTYNSTTGKVTNTPVDVPANMAQDEIDVKEVDDASFVKDHFQVIVAGLDIDPVEPEITDRVVTPLGTEHEIVRIKTDQYKAAYILYVKKKGV